MPDHVTVNWWKEERGARIFVDFNQMARDRTIASAYSIRPTLTAVVSAPLTWDELGEAAPEDFTVSSMARAIGKDEFPCRRCEVAVRDIDRDALLALGTQTVGEQSKISSV